jgi:hypothetical protein|nr:MAG TPA: hypothetical protein [Caudoviricetes sp.]
MKLIGVRFLGRTLLFSRSFLYVLILINLFINVKKFANFLDNFLKRKGERRMVELSISLRSGSVEEAIEKIARIKEAHPEDVLKIDVTILDDYLLNS